MRRWTVEKSEARGKGLVGIQVAEQCWDTHLRRGDRQWNVRLGWWFSSRLWWVVRHV